VSILYVPPLKYDPDTLAQMRRLWEDMPELSASKIGAMFGVTKNVVIGHRWRRGWNVRRPTTKEPQTVFERMDALDARLDRVLAETRADVEADRAKRAAIEAQRKAA
jgi:hypothetical protein